MNLCEQEGCVLNWRVALAFKAILICMLLILPRIEWFRIHLSLLHPKWFGVKFIGCTSSGHKSVCHLLDFL